MLDSAHNGVVTSDNQVKVIKKEGTLAYEGQTGAMVYNTITTPRGRQWQLALSDGTRVWLNAQSSIRYPISFTGAERRVVITGEAYFEVAQQAQASFVVQSGNQEIQVLGTHFNVNTYEDEPRYTTTLLEGKIKVNAGGKSVILRPGEQVANNYQTGELKIKNADINGVTAWINGRFRFDQSDIRMVMRQLARWYDVDIVYADHLPDYHFAGGTFRNTNLAEVLHVLELSGVHFKVENRKITVMP